VEANEPGMVTAMSVTAQTKFSLQRMTSDQTAGSAVIALLAGLLAAFAGGSPTGVAVWDGALQMLLAMAVVVAAAKAQRWPVIVMASLAAAASGLSLWGLVAWIAVAVSIASTLQRRRSRLLGAIAAALAMQSLLRLPVAGFWGLQSLLAGIAVLPVLLSGYRYGTKRAQQLTRWIVAGGLVIVGTILLVGSVAMLGVRSDVDRGVAAARRGLEAARSGDTESVAGELEIAKLALGSANDKARSISARLLRLVPVASQHQHIVETASSAGAAAASDAAAVVTGADITAISLKAGEVDLSALTAMAPQLRTTATTLESAVQAIDQADSQWLLPLVRNRMVELRVEIEGSSREVALAADAAETVPAMLGQQGQRTYFIMFGTPAESRELGGFLGSWALVSFDQGRLQLGDSGRIGRLYDLARQSEVVSADLPPWYLEMARPTTFPQNLPSSPDFGLVAEVAAQVLGEVSERGVDGFIYLDAHALVSFLELTGPIQTPVKQAPLTSENAGQFFFQDQYRFDASIRTEVFDQLASVAGDVVQQLNAQELPGPEELGRVMGPAARGGHLQVVTFDDQTNDFLRSVKLLRDFGRNDTQDFVGLVQTNGLANKADLYLRRRLEYRIVVGESGGVDATALVTLRSDVPGDAPPFTLGTGATEGINKVLLSLYSPLVLERVTVNGAPVDVRIASEFDMGRYLVEVDVLPNADPVVVEYSLSGSLAPNEPYSLEVWHQPLVNDDDVAISAVGPDFEISWDGKLVENLIVSADPGEAS